MMNPEMRIPMEANSIAAAFEPIDHAKRRR